MLHVNFCSFSGQYFAHSCKNCAALLFLKSYITVFFYIYCHFFLNLCSTYPNCFSSFLCSPTTFIVMHQFLVCKNRLGNKPGSDSGQSVRKEQMNNSLEFFGTFRLPYVIALQRQLTAHDLNKVLRKQPCERRANVNKLKIGTFKLLV